MFEHLLKPSVPLPKLAISLVRKDKKHCEERYSAETDWYKIDNNYDDYILGPFCREMLVLESSGHTRNPVIEKLKDYSHDNLRTMAIADFGCGSGHLLKHLNGIVDKITGIDISDTALQIAALRAPKYRIQFEAVNADMRFHVSENKFDQIISVNSIMPKKRDEVLIILNNIKKSLQPEGKLLAILPSFDTVMYLKSLWLEYYRNTYTEKYANERMLGFNKERMVDEKELLYAHDGSHAQCHHTKESILFEFKKAGLHILYGPEKVYYPWELTRRHDYWYFPDAPEEIWDWFVVASRMNP